MSAEHNLMALQVADVLLNQLRTGVATWHQPKLSTKVIRWPGRADWPRPDIAFEDRSTTSSIAIEFKPPRQQKSEYVRGLGQTITYLDKFEFAGLVVPERADDGFDIAKYFQNILSSMLNPLPIALFSYGRNPPDLTVLRSLTVRDNPPPALPRGKGRGTFWAYWRDLSNYDLLTLLRLADQSPKRSFDPIFAKFWKEYATEGKAQEWAGKNRKTKAKDAKGFNGERANAWLAMRHTGLLDSTSTLTAAGYEVMRAGRVYGPGSTAFLELLAHQVLTEGQHLELIFWLEQKQRGIPRSKKANAPTFYKALDAALVRDGIIPPRPHVAGKPTFLRDEPKLWNKLGLLVREGKERYFHPGYGFVFDWRKIISVIEVGP
jgi:hypothetical protein